MARLGSNSVSSPTALAQSTAAPKVPATLPCLLPTTSDRGPGFLSIAIASLIAWTPSLVTGIPKRDPAPNLALSRWALLPARLASIPSLDPASALSADGPSHSSPWKTSLARTPGSLPTRDSRKAIMPNGCGHLHLLTPPGGRVRYALNHLRSSGVATGHGPRSSGNPLVDPDRHSGGFYNSVCRAYTAVTDGVAGALAISPAWERRRRIAPRRCSSTVTLSFLATLRTRRTKRIGR